MALIFFSLTLLLLSLLLYPSCRLLTLLLLLSLLFLSNQLLNTPFHILCLGLISIAFGLRL